MTSSNSASLAAAQVTDHPTLPLGGDERFTGYGVIGLGFTSGDYLTLRVMTRTSIGTPYVAVWHRDPADAWTIRTTAPFEESCPRYFGGASHNERVPRIDVRWTGDDELAVAIPGVLEWHLELEATASTRLMTAVAGVMPDVAWRSDAVLGSMGPMVRPVLRAGRLRMVGSTPNGQHFQAAPRLLWHVRDSQAVLRGRDFGSPAPLHPQTRLGDFWMPQQGLFFVGDARFEALDPARHVVVRSPRISQDAPASAQ